MKTKKTKLSIIMLMLIAFIGTAFAGTFSSSGSSPTYDGNLMCMSGVEASYDFSGSNFSNVGRFNNVYYVEPGNASDIQAKADLCDGGTCKIIIPSGEYEFDRNLTINGNTSLICNDWNSKLSWDGLTEPYLIYINNNGNNVNIENCDIRGRQDSRRLIGFHIGRHDNIKIINNHIYNSNRSVINLNGTNILIKDNLIENVVDGISFGDIGDDETIFVQVLDNILTSNIQINDDNEYGEGIEFNYHTNPNSTFIAKGNRIEGFGEDGIDCNGKYCIISNNEFIGTNYGYIGKDTELLSIQHNNGGDSSDYGVSTITGNIFRGISQYGIRILESNNLVIDGNIFTDSNSENISELGSIAISLNRYTDGSDAFYSKNNLISNNGFNNINISVYSELRESDVNIKIIGNIYNNVNYEYYFNENAGDTTNVFKLDHKETIQNIEDRDLLGYYSMTSRSCDDLGCKILDGSKNNNDLTISGISAPTFEDGKYHSLGTGSGYLVGETILDGSEEFTMIVTADLDQFSSAALISLNDADYKPRWGIEKPSDNIFTFYTGNTTNTYQFESPVLITPSGGERTYAVVYSGSNKNNYVKMYMNGELMFFDNTSEGILPSVDLTGITSLHIGNIGDRTDLIWNGTIDEVLIYNRTLDDREIEAIYQKKYNTIQDSKLDRESGGTIYGNLDMNGNEIRNVSNINITNILNLNPISTAPTNLVEGNIYFDSDLHKPCYYNSTTWVTFDGTGTCS